MALSLIEMSTGCTLNDKYWDVPKGKEYFGIGEPLGLSSNIFTIEFAVTITEYTGVTSDKYLIGDLAYNNTTTFYVAIKAGSLYLYYSRTSTGTMRSIAGPKITVGNTYIVHIVSDGTGVYLYINGSIYASNTTYPLVFRTGDAGSLAIQIDSYSSIRGNDYIGAKWYGIAIYEKVLSADEIYSNIEAYKSRFDLTL